MGLLSRAPPIPTEAGGGELQVAGMELMEEEHEEREWIIFFWFQKLNHE